MLAPKTKIGWFGAFDFSASKAARTAPRKYRARRFTGAKIFSCCTVTSVSAFQIAIRETGHWLAEAVIDGPTKLNGQDARWPHSQDGCATRRLHVVVHRELVRVRS